MDHPRSRSLSRPPPYETTPLPSTPQHQRAASGGTITPLTALHTKSLSSIPSVANPVAPARAATVPRRRSSPVIVSASILEPRIAVVLKVPKPWRPWLFFSRLLSICPAIFWGLRPALQLVTRALLALPLSALLEAAADMGVNVGEAAHNSQWKEAAVTQTQLICPAGAPGAWPTPRGRPFMYPWTEMVLGVMWCGVSGYLSFFFADCLMSRWLIRYSPQAAIIRLLTINCTNAFLTERILFIVGGFEDARLLLPGWISIATTLTICYHITQRKINIKKETSTSINIFSIASFLSMVALLAHLHSDRSDYPVPPIYQYGRMFMDYWQTWRNGGVGPSGTSSVAAKCDL
ncbi:N-glycosylation protein-domain-containing protein [Plectosphaerella cucumerina]|uniref:N-glycosylation protein-domain-containing protein n=1 Tax=Plectosphaerella cucumerina TaxID=40658 RepID=A0A8K0X2M3_9PEZI|nr:N-glycosylation protein-domain-containing protein [Plectosphaerella cucumerina]